ncbi:SDR family oxidoreductase [Cryobacterium sinapicolor]|uniref:SDR family oxidoreductase n=1 Tax=Cryobacterium sinapicolor TaxID=1259236 RepID=A0ABY2IV34_9MICO|nr:MULTISPECIES: SDR family oxidoreductase [Cryobacterium]TFC93188.1 SDR family oxidoreductase [Cryobacterium sp. TMT3-29-2]TFC94299.1 SDR family oxidoreductase [Cryobacterium sinapicolor]
MGAILVTGASGTVGRAVAAALVSAGESVVSAVRNPAGSEFALNPPAGTPRAFDFADPTGWDGAFSGVDRLFLLRPPAIANVADTLIPVIDTALERGIRQIVFLSLQGVQFNPATPHHAVEKHLRLRRAPYTFLRPNFFMQNLSTVYRDGIREQGEIYLPAARARTAFVDARDIGRVAARVFTEPGHLRTAYTLSGEQSLNYDQVAEILSEVLGRRITYARPSSGDYLARLAEQGAPADFIAVQKMIYRVVRLGVSAFPNRAIRRLTGEPATTFRQFAADHRDVWL